MPRLFSQAAPGLVLGRRLVLAGPEVPVGVAPAVVDHPVGHAVVVAAEQLGEAQRVLVLAGVRPLDVVPEDVRGEPLDEVADVEVGVGRVGGITGPVAQDGLERVVGRPVGDVPVQATGVVHPEPQAGGPRRLRERLDEVAAGAAVHGVARPRARGVPERDAVVVLARGHDVLRAGPGEEADEVVRVEGLGVPVVEEGVVRRGAEDLPVVLASRAALQPDRVRVPLRVRVVPEPGGPVDRPELARRLRPGGHGVGPPVHEDAQLRGREPRGHGPGEPVPGRGGGHSPRASR